MVKSNLKTILTLAVIALLGIGTFSCQKEEEKEKKTLLALNAAMEAFKKDGDTAKFDKAQEAALLMRF